MKRLLCCIMALTMIGSATAFAAEPVDNSAIAEKALSEVTALYEDLYTITNAEAEVQNSTYDDMGNIIVDVVVSFDRTLKATCAEDMPYIQGLEIALTELTDPDEISAASAYIDAKKADLEDNYIGVAQDTYIELQVTVPIATARSNAAQAIGIDNIEYVGMNENVPAKELAPDSNQAMMESGQAAILNITERMATPSTRASTINSVIKNYDRVRARDYARDWSCTNGSLYDHATCHNPEYTFYIISAEPGSGFHVRNEDSLLQWTPPSTWEPVADVEGYGVLCVAGHYGATVRNSMGETCEIDLVCNVASTSIWG